MDSRLSMQNTELYERSQLSDKNLHFLFLIRAVSWRSLVKVPCQFFHISFKGCYHRRSKMLISENTQQLEGLG